METPRSRILVIVDDQASFSAMTLGLRRHFDVTLAPNGAVALALLHAHGPPSVVLSDLDIPGMDGVTFLASVRSLYPRTMRILMCAKAGIAAVVNAINEAQVFRCVARPCALAALVTAIDAAIMHQQTEERAAALAARTSNGSVDALMTLLSLAQPPAYKWARSLEALAGEISEMVWPAGRRDIELAASCSQLGCVTLPFGVAEKIYFSQPLTAAEAGMVTQLPAWADNVLEHLPQLEVARQVLRRSVGRGSLVLPATEPERSTVMLGAQVLAAAAEYLLLEAHGETPIAALAILRARRDWVDPTILDALHRVRCSTDEAEDVREIPLAAVLAGMVLASDVRLTAGQLLAARGYVTTEAFVERCRNAKPGSVEEPIRIVLPRTS